MSQMNYLFKINMIYICPPGSPHDVIADLTFHFIVATVDALQIFARSSVVEHFQLNYDKSTDISQRWRRWEKLLLGDQTVFLRS